MARLFGISVLLFGPVSAAAKASRTPKGLTSQAFRTYIWPKPVKKGRFLGYVRIGQRVALRKGEPIKTPGCRRGFYPVEPRGYVCHDRTVTIATSNEFLRANAHTKPDRGAFPYEYAISNGAPMYSRLPTKKERWRVEWPYGKVGKFHRLPLFQRGHEHLAVTVPIEAEHPMPSFLSGGRGARGRPVSLVRRTIPLGALMAYSRSFAFEGRTYLLSTDLTLVPADRVRRFRRSTFRGTPLGEGLQLPIAWARWREVVAYRRDASGGFFPTEDKVAIRQFVPVEAEPIRHAGKVWRRIKSATGEGRYVDASAVTVVDKASKLPFGVQATDKWMEVRIMRGTLVAYEGLKPVYATLMSPGQGGVPRRGGDLVRDSTTPMGTYRITFKDRSTMMAPMTKPRKFWAAEVPFTQYFRAPFAIHGAYWHEKFGQPISAGCVNLSPLDAAHLFSWTDPPVPEGWHGAAGAGAPENGPASLVVVRR